jgi:hypothetical protein
VVVIPERPLSPAEGERIETVLRDLIAEIHVDPEIPAERRERLEQLLREVGAELGRNPDESRRTPP